ncbi:hypothetical protein [uncultured Draconibacterium sp.]|uniref:hypothetical protein n=1 Tax=uncultured Draconibacterium sp. TaxID=1573823 RepID=UPI0025D4F4C5|nr:hypothetical protein [uncultured Draconibacterium sp.]
MKANIFLLFIIVSMIACDNNSTLIELEPEPELDSCEFYATGYYNDTVPGKIPQKYWPCMSTEVLVEAGSYNFPSLYMLMAGCCGLQSGYDLCRNKYDWFVELENREDALEYLIAKYKSIDTVSYAMNLYPFEWPGYKFYTYNLEVFMAQEAYLTRATNSQLMELLNELFIKQNVRNGNRGDYGIEGPSFTMSRIMYFNNYEPLLDSMEQNFKIKMLVELGSFSISSEEGKDAQTSIFNLTTAFMNELTTEEE